MPTFGLGPVVNFSARACGQFAHYIEDLGFEALWIPDERFYRDMIVTLAVVSQSTSRLLVGTAVTDPYIRHPALTAQWTASIDELSGGRMRVGIGAGIAGFSALGIKRRRPVVAIREMVELMRQLWTGAMVDYQGETAQYRSASLDFTPPRAEIPCYVAGRGPKVLELAGRIGDGAILGSLASAGGLQYAFEHLDAGLAASGRLRTDIDTAIWLHTAVSDDRMAARDAVREIVVGILISSFPVLGQLGVAISPQVHEALQGLRYEHGSPEMLAVARMLDDSVIDQFSAAGKPEDVASRIQEIHSAGVNHFALKPWLVPGQTLESFAKQVAEEVIPGIQ